VTFLFLVSDNELRSIYGKQEWENVRHHMKPFSSQSPPKPSNIEFRESYHVRSQKQQTTPRQPYSVQIAPPVSF
jgi:hypothetical protein